MITQSRMEELIARAPTMSYAQRISELRPHIKQATKELSTLAEERTELLRKKEALDYLIEWAESNQATTLEKNECSRLHRLHQAMNDEDVIESSKGEFLSAKEKSLIVSGVQCTFVVKHDWAKAFGNNKPTGVDDLRIPYEHCAFEFRISGANVIVIACQDYKAASTPVLLGFLEAKSLWVCFDGSAANEHPVFLFAWDQIKCICAALDAEVATTHVERAPCKLNEKRERRGLVKMYDYRVVDLAHRHRTVGPNTVEGSRKRLHFRRGHWRHYEDHKTWINWMLVGDPDLGFVDKHYAL